MVLCTWQKQESWKCGNQECPNHGSSFFCARGGKDDLLQGAFALEVFNGQAHWTAQSSFPILACPFPQMWEGKKRICTCTHTSRRYLQKTPSSQPTTYSSKKGYTVSNSLFIYIFPLKEDRRKLPTPWTEGLSGKYQKHSHYSYTRKTTRKLTSKKFYISTAGLLPVPIS